MGGWTRLWSEGSDVAADVSESASVDIKADTVVSATAIIISFQRAAQYSEILTIAFHFGRDFNHQDLYLILSRSLEKRETKVHCGAEIMPPAGTNSLLVRD